MTEERLAFKAEVSRLLEIVVHSLYSEKEIFLRELISNASDACDKLRYEALTEPALTGDDPDFRITLSIDPKARTLTVSDNGIGMGRDDLIENLGTIAQSGTAAFLEQLDAAKKGDVTQIGQFGVGFYAAFMVAQMVEVTSRRAGTDEVFCWSSDGKGEFTVEKAQKSTRGTDVTIYLKQGEDEFLGEDRLRALVTHYSDHIALPIFLNGEDKPLNRASALWMRAKSEIKPEQYREFYHHVAHSFEEPALTSHWRAEGKIEYTGLLFVPGVKPYDLFDPKRRHGVKLYVKRVFITDEAEGLVPPYLRFLRGVVDSEDLPLNVSREMLQNNPMLAKIRQGVVRRVLGDLVKMAAQEQDSEASEAEQKAYGAFWSNFGLVLKEGLYEDGANREELLKLLRCQSTHGPAPTSLASYVARMKEGQKAIYYINGDNPEMLAQSPHLEGFKARGVEVLLLTDTVDDFWPGTVNEYEGKPLRSVTRADLELGDIPLEEKGEDQKAETPPAPEGSEALLALIKKTLGDKIKDARLSERLTESPVCLAAGEGDLDIHLERFLKQHNQIRTPSARILEVNASHPLIRALAAKAQKENEAPELADSIWLLLDQARILDGEAVLDPMAFSQRLARLITKES